MVGVYCRVSTDEQAKNETIQLQVDFARRYVELHGLGEAAFYLDEGVSGVVPFADRPGGSALLADVRAGKLSEVLVVRLDRLGRSARLILNVVHELEGYGVRIRSMTEPFYTDDPVGRFILTILAGVADFEREVIVERMMAGQRRAVAAGRWPGTPPYGYRKNAQGLIEPDETPASDAGLSPAAVVRLAYRLVGERGYTTVDLAQYLNALGIPSPRGKSWLPATLHSILRDPLYRGERVFGRHAVRPGAERITCPVPALVTPELWHAVREVMAERGRKNWYKPKYRYLLTGLVRCGLCGSRFSGRTKKRWNARGMYLERMYVCNRRRSGGPAACNCPTVNADRLEAEVWGDIVAFVENPGPALDRLVSAAGVSREARAAELGRLAAVVESKTAERERVLDLYRRGFIDVREVEVQLRKIAEEKGALEARLAELEAEAAAADGALARAAEIERLCGLLRERIRLMDDFDFRRRLVMLLVKEVVVYPADPCPGPGSGPRVEVAYCFGPPDRGGSGERAASRICASSSDLAHLRTGLAGLLESE